MGAVSGRFSRFPSRSTPGATTDAVDGSALALGEEPITPCRATSPSIPTRCASARGCSTTSVFRTATRWRALPACWRWRRRQPGPRRGLGRRAFDFNAPTVFNVALSFRLNWRGLPARSKSRRGGAAQPRLMNTTWEELLPKLRADEAYEDAFAIWGRPGAGPCWMRLRPFSAR